MAIISIGTISCPSSCLDSPLTRPKPTITSPSPRSPISHTPSPSSSFHLNPVISTNSKLPKSSGRSFTSFTSFVIVCPNNRSTNTSKKESSTSCGSVSTRMRYSMSKKESTAEGFVTLPPSPFVSSHLWPVIIVWSAAIFVKVQVTVSPASRVTVSPLGGADSPTDSPSYSQTILSSRQSGGTVSLIV